MIRHLPNGRAVLTQLGGAEALSFPQIGARREGRAGPGDDQDGGIVQFSQRNFQLRQQRTIESVSNLGTMEREASHPVGLRPQNRQIPSRAQE